MLCTILEITDVERLLNAACRTTTDVGKLRLMRTAGDQCKHLKARISHEVHSTPFTNMTEAKMKARDTMMRDVLQQILRMANAVRTAGELEPDLRKGVYKYNPQMLFDPILSKHVRFQGYFDQNLKDALGLGPRTTRPIDLFIPGVGVV
jgi:hypothetical protein